MKENNIVNRSLINDLFRSSLGVTPLVKAERSHPHELILNAFKKTLDSALFYFAKIILQFLSRENIYSDDGEMPKYQ